MISLASKMNLPSLAQHSVRFLYHLRMTLCFSLRMFPSNTCTNPTFLNYSVLNYSVSSVHLSYLAFNPSSATSSAFFCHFFCHFFNPPSAFCHFFCHSPQLPTIIALGDFYSSFKFISLQNLLWHLRCHQMNFLCVDLMLWRCLDCVSLY